MLIAKTPRYLEGGGLRLRPLRITDGPALAKMLGQEDILRSSGKDGPLKMPWFRLYFFLKKTFFFHYCIEDDSKTIGFTGLFSLLPDRSAEMALVIFDASARRRGHGTTAFRLLATALQSHPFIENLTVSVRRDNLGSLAFWNALGFEDIGGDKDVQRLTMRFLYSNIGIL